MIAVYRKQGNSNKRDYKTKSIIRAKEDHYIIIKGSTDYKAIVILNWYN